MNVDRSSLSPMMMQYFEVKDKYPDHIVFFRLGDFYEMFSMMPLPFPERWSLPLRAGTAVRRSVRLCAAFPITAPRYT